jgi:hypothetical protein
MILPSESKESQVLKLKLSRDKIVSWLDPTGQGVFRAIEKVYSHAVSKNGSYHVGFGTGLKLIFSIDLSYCEAVYLVSLEKKGFGEIGNYVCRDPTDCVGMSLKLLRSYFPTRQTSDLISEILVENGV